jgi:hypothetical protein
MVHPITLAQEYSTYWDHKTSQFEVTKNVGSVATAPYPYHGAGSFEFSSRQMWLTVALAPVIPLISLRLSWQWYDFYMISVFNFVSLRPCPRGPLSSTKY